MNHFESGSPEALRALGQVILSTTMKPRTTRNIVHLTADQEGWTVDEVMVDLAIRELRAIGLSLLEGRSLGSDSVTAILGLPVQRGGHE